MKFELLFEDDIKKEDSFEATRALSSLQTVSNFLAEQSPSKESQELVDVIFKNSMERRKGFFHYLRKNHDIKKAMDRTSMMETSFEKCVQKKYEFLFKLKKSVARTPQALSDKKTLNFTYFQGAVTAFGFLGLFLLLAVKIMKFHKNTQRQKIMVGVTVFLFGEVFLESSSTFTKRLSRRIIVGIGSLEVNERPKRRWILSSLFGGWLGCVDVAWVAWLCWCGVEYALGDQCPTTSLSNCLSCRWRNSIKKKTKCSTTVAPSTLGTPQTNDPETFCFHLMGVGSLRSQLFKKRKWARRLEKQIKSKS